MPDFLPVSLQDIMYSWKSELRAYEIKHKKLDLNNKLFRVRSCGKRNDAHSS